MNNWIVVFVFWYPACMSTFWIIGSVLFYFRVERKKPLALTETPKVSILVPCYNEEQTLEKTIRELDGLTYPDYEIIAIDDGSQDRTYPLLCELERKYSRLRVVELETNSGKANALYHGLLAAKGEIIVSVDADSYLASDALEYMVPHFTNPKNGERVGAVTGNPRVRNRSSLLAKVQLCEYASIVSMIKRTQRMLGKVMTVSGVIVAFRKRALLDSQLWDKDMVTEDVAVTWKLEKNFWDVRYEPRALCWMLVPETVKGLWKQRSRWIHGGIEVMGRNRGIFRDWSRRRMYPLFLEQIVSITWAFCWLYLLILGVISVLRGGSFMPYFWKSQFLSFVCIVQFVVAMLLDRRYDPKLIKYSIWTIWYPILFWYLNAFVVIITLPKMLFSRKKEYATWESPDRGLGTEEKAEDLAAATSEECYWEIDAKVAKQTEKTEPKEQGKKHSLLGQETFSGEKTGSRKKVSLPGTPVSAEGIEEHIIDGQQKRWKRVIELLITTAGWIYMGSYLIYVVYGLIARIAGLPVVELFIYTEEMLEETRHLFLVLFIVIAINYLLLYTWRIYNSRKFGRKNRRKFPPQVSDHELATYFSLPIETVVRMKNEKRIVLKDNLV